jgi:hypothetical protein
VTCVADGGRCGMSFWHFCKAACNAGAFTDTPLIVIVLPEPDVCDAEI